MTDSHERIAPRLFRAMREGEFNFAYLTSREVLMELIYLIQTDRREKSRLTKQTKLMMTIWLNEIIPLITNVTLYETCHNAIGQLLIDPKAKRELDKLFDKLCYEYMSKTTPSLERKELLLLQQ